MMGLEVYVGPMRSASVDWGVVVAAIALVASLVTAVAAWRQRYMDSRRQQLLRLLEEFEAADYRMRFWRLGLAIRKAQETADADLGQAELLMSTSPSTHQHPWDALLPIVFVHDQPKVIGADHFTRFTGQLNEDSIRPDFLGPDWSFERSDLADFWMFSVKVAHWVSDRNRPRWAWRPNARAKNADEMTVVFGNRLVMTMSGHREAASRIVAAHVSLSATAPASLEGSASYYRKHYGLRDREYVRVVDTLAESAARLGLVTSRHKRVLAKTECRLAELPYRGTAQEPETRLRESPFPHPEWLGV